MSDPSVQEADADLAAPDTEAGPPELAAQAAAPAPWWTLRYRGLIAAVAVVMAVLAYTSYRSAAQGVIALFIAAVVVVLAAVDIQRGIIPNQLVLPATAIVFIARVVTTPNRTIELLLVALGAGLAFLIPNLISSSLIGMGDVKFIAFLGAGMGLAAIGATIVAFLAVFPVAIVIVLRNGIAARKSTIPFGPFLALGALVILIVPRLIELGAP